MEIIPSNLNLIPKSKEVYEMNQHINLDLANSLGRLLCDTLGPKSNGSKEGKKRRRVAKKSPKEKNSGKL